MDIQFIPELVVVIARVRGSLRLLSRPHSTLRRRCGIKILTP